MIPDPDSIPTNPEHIEAYQASVNADRKEYVSKLPAADQERFYKLEAVCRELEAMQMKFVLIAAPELENPKLWTFNRYSYHEVLSDESVKDISMWSWHFTHRILTTYLRLQNLECVLTRDGQPIVHINRKGETTDL